MATGGEVGGQTSDNAGSEDLTDVKCQPCHEEGEIRDAVGICLDCQDYLCRRCFDGHKIPRPSRNHQLLDNQQMIQKNVKLKRKDKCTRVCPSHDDDVIKYYCIKHGQLSCNVCLSLNHRTCKPVQYIPDAAKDLDNNADFTEVKTCLNTALDICKNISDIGNQTIESIQTSCAKALASVESHRRDINHALDQIQSDIVEKAEAMKTKMLHKVAYVMDQYQHTFEELQQIRSSSEQLRRANQNCDLYTEMMSMKRKLGSLLTDVKKVEREQNLLGNKIQFSANPELLRTLQRPETFGTLIYEASHAPIVEVKLECEIEIKVTSEENECMISGATFLSDSILMITDWKNGTVKVVDVKRQEVVAKTKMSSDPWDICKIQHNQVAVSLTNEGKIAFMTVSDRGLKVDRTLEVDGPCRGLDFRDDKLAVSFSSTNKIQVLTVHGSVLHDIKTTRNGKTPFDDPYYLKFGQDGTTLYVSNWGGSTVICVALDGTVVASYSDNELGHPMGIEMDSAGNLYVCEETTSSIHQVSTDLKKMRTLLKETGNYEPWSISYRESENMFYVGMCSSNKINVYRAICE